MRQFLRWLRLGAVGTFFTGILSVIQGCDTREGALAAVLLVLMQFCAGPAADSMATPTQIVLFSVGIHK